MDIDVLLGGALGQASGLAAAAEARGFDAVWVGETQHDPFLTAASALAGTRRATVGTSVAIAFARSPMTVAQTAYDLAALGEGRFVLGLGTQVRAHIERRFSMPWSEPVARLREYVAALSAIWSAWQDGTPLRFAGDFYTHTLMTPFFTPPAHEFGPPPVYLAAVNPRLTEVAGEVADGFLFHAFTTPDVVRSVTRPALQRGRDRSGRSGMPVVAGPVFVATGDSESSLVLSRDAVRQQLAFYASTPGYRSVLEHHGWGDLQPELTALSKAGRWAEMAGLIDDDVVAAFAVVAPLDQVGAAIADRWFGVADRITLYSPDPLAPGVVDQIVTGVRAHPRPARTAR